MNFRAKRIEFRLFANPLQKSTEFILAAEDQNGKWHSAKIEWIEADMDLSVPMESEQIRGADDWMQVLMADLWRMGVRPLDLVDMKPTIEAKQSHIDSLERIVDRIIPAALRKPS